MLDRLLDMFHPLSVLNAAVTAWPPWPMCSTLVVRLLFMLASSRFFLFTNLLFLNFPIPSVTVPLDFPFVVYSLPKCANLAFNLFHFWVIRCNTFHQPVEFRLKFPQPLGDVLKFFIRQLSILPGFGMLPGMGPSSGHGIGLFFIRPQRAEGSQACKDDKQ